MSATGTSDPTQRAMELVIGMRAVLNELEALLAGLASRPVAEATEPLLSLDQLCARIPYQPQTIRNLINKGELRRDVHYLQRRRHGKIVFVWSAMERWLRDRQLDRATVEPFLPAHNARTRKIR